MAGNTSKRTGIIDAHSADKRWIINVQGIKRGRKQPLPIKLSEILTQMEGRLR